MRALEAIVILHLTGRQTAIITNSIAAAESWSRGGHDDDVLMAMQQHSVLGEDAATCDTFPAVPDAGRLRRSARPLFQDDGPPPFAE